MTPDEIAAAIQAGALLLKLATDAIAASQLAEAQREALFSQLEQALDERVARCRARQPVPLPPA